MATGGNLSKFKLKLIDREKFGQRCGVQKSPLKFEQFRCAVCKNGNVCQRRTPHKVKNIPNMTHSKMENLIGIERVKMWDASLPPLPSWCRVVCSYRGSNLCASDTAKLEHNVFHILSCARKRAHSEAIFSQRLPRFSREPFSYFLRIFPVI